MINVVLYVDINCDSLTSAMCVQNKNANNLQLWPNSGQNGQYVKWNSSH